jgi:hypothetical protein
VPEVAENGAFAFLTARHVDDLTEAIRAQTQNQAIANELTKNQTAAVKALTSVLERLTDIMAPKAPEAAASDVALDESTAGESVPLAVGRTSSRDIK